MDDAKLPKNPVLEGLDAGWKRAIWPDGTQVHISEPEKLPTMLYVEIGASMQAFREKMGPLRFLSDFEKWMEEYRIEITRLVWAGFNAGRDQG